jgi:hypothetical protein
MLTLPPSHKIKAIDILDNAVNERSTLQKTMQSEVTVTGGTWLGTGKELEAASGFEPENNGFADRCLTTWLCRHFMERATS